MDPGSPFRLPGQLGSNGAGRPRRLSLGSCQSGGTGSPTSTGGTHMLLNHLERLRASRKGEAGFTLIELLIVIVILGVLAGIVVFSVRGITDRGDTAACKSNLKATEVAVEAYYAKKGSNPTTTGTGATGLVPDYLKQ